MTPSEQQQKQYRRDSVNFPSLKIKRYPLGAWGLGKWYTLYRNNQKHLDRGLALVPFLQASISSPPW